MTEKYHEIYQPPSEKALPHFNEASFLKIKKKNPEKMIIFE